MEQTGNALKRRQVWAVYAGAGPMDAFLGDWDANGRIDVVTLSSEGCRLWKNEGGGRLVEAINLSGEFAYIHRSKALCGNTCDINNDGHQDIFIAYAVGTAPQIFFNRIFGSFRHAHRPIDFSELGRLPEAEKGQQAGVVVDLTDDGAQDMAVGLLNGEIHVFIRSLESGSSLAARVALPAGASQSGPITVTASNEVHSLGAWVVQPGVNEAFLGRLECGPLNVSWRLPGGFLKGTRLDVIDEGSDPMHRILIPTDK